MQLTNMLKKLKKKMLLSYEAQIFHQPAWSMLGDCEGQSLFEIAKDRYTGRGEIIDAGAFVGSSAKCFAQGLAANKKLNESQKIKRIWSYDKFVADDPYVLEHLRRSLDASVQHGDRFVRLFEAHLTEYSSMVNVEAGDFLLKKWVGKPIEILFVDVAKNVPLSNHVFAEFVPSLIPGRSWVIHQDYYHPWLPHIHVAMSYLADYFEVVEDKLDDTRIWKYVRAVPAEMLDKVSRYDFLVEDQLLLMSQEIRRIKPKNRHHSLLAEAVLYWQLGRVQEARMKFDALARISKPDDAHWAMYIAQCRQAIFP